MAAQPAEPIAVVGVEVRRWRPEDASALHVLVLANLEHLRPWMPWVAGEPLTFAERCGLVETWMTAWDAGSDFSFAIVDAAGGELLGACGAHRRIGPGGLEVGYWVRSDRTGRGVASAAVGAVVGAVSTVDGVDRLEIHHDAANLASGRVAEKAGFSRIEEHPDEVSAPGEIGIEVVWRLDLTT
ncbi:GNAT family N-acetyltransferase [Actinomarinicola tropica]|uniref:GNAT family N-acetyltransferase n=1 Tax=Actinomarinicola tropica TaxID=2789776 RepID=A0A5Q2RN68_9ACTN|nr:GNAT family N-acetyltransferase [Actinomarinicola tropica]QGG95537.1 GNAT family N-acetyltransferase [Actinomarinicola tropica]